ncbi:hypothetical protein [Rubritalea tangerina]|uniref:hypothetical protein n=1 Tax=Rubritalea tangerina TaxID=430798 RepID=UPI0036125B56
MRAPAVTWLGQIEFTNAVFVKIMGDDGPCAFWEKQVTSSGQRESDGIEGRGFVLCTLCFQLKGKLAFKMILILKYNYFSFGHNEPKNAGPFVAIFCFTVNNTGDSNGLSFWHF